MWNYCRFADLFNSILFQALQYRKNRAGLKALLQDNPEYQQLDADTLEVMSVMLELPSIWKQREKYVKRNEWNKEEYDMCQAMATAECDREFINHIRTGGAG